MTSEVAATTLSPTAASRIQQLPAELAVALVLDASPTQPQWMDHITLYLGHILKELSVPYVEKKAIPNVSGTCKLMHT